MEEIGAAIQIIQMIGRGFTEIIKLGRETSIEQAKRKEMAKRIDDLEEHEKVLANGGIISHKDIVKHFNNESTVINFYTEDPQKLAEIEDKMAKMGIHYIKLDDLDIGDQQTQYLIPTQDVNKFNELLKIDKTVQAECWEKERYPEEELDRQEGEGLTKEWQAAEKRHDEKGLEAGRFTFGSKDFLVSNPSEKQINELKSKNGSKEFAFEANTNFVDWNKNSKPSVIYFKPCYKNIENANFEVELPQTSTRYVKEENMFYTVVLPDQKYHLVDRTGKSEGTIKKEISGDELMEMLEFDKNRTQLNDRAIESGNMDYMFQPAYVAEDAELYRMKKDALDKDEYFSISVPRENIHACKNNEGFSYTDIHRNDGTASRVYFPNNHIKGNTEGMSVVRFSTNRQYSTQSYNKNNGDKSQGKMSGKDVPSLFSGAVPEKSREKNSKNLEKEKIHKQSYEKNI